MSLHLQRRSRAPVVALLLLAACRADAPTGAAGPQAPVTISAALVGTDIEVLTVIVTGPGIRSPIVGNTEPAPSAAIALVQMEVPVGGQRTFTVRGYDAAGTVTHEGMATAVVHPGENPTLPVRLYARTGDVPIAVGVGSFDLAIAPSPLANATVGETRQLTATVSDGQGATVPGAVVTWGSLNPIVAGIDGSGRITARTAGTTTFYASYRGLATASVDLTVDAPPVRFRDIVAGWFFTCALDDVGAAWCWGQNGEGQLGDGTPTPRERPVRVIGGHQFVALAAGGAHACGITATGEAWCWGRNGEAQLGIGRSGAGESTPQRVLGLPSLQWTSIAAGFTRTCGIAAGDAWCWGSGSSSSFPTLYFSAPGVPWTSVAIGAGSTIDCFLLGDGRPECRIPSSSTVTRASVFAIAWRTLYVADLHPTTIGPFPWVPADPFACGLTLTGDVRCWGNAEYGELGRGAGPNGTGGDFQTAPANVDGAQGYGALSVGLRFACGLRSGQALCWGLNDHGQLGDGTQSNRFVPTPVAGGWRVTRIAAGLSHACGLLADGTAFCWGENRFGELGDGTTTLRSAPVVVRPTFP
jgi:alpha-tubulin suppressor-like RCC1 family protein